MLKNYFSIIFLFIILSSINAQTTAIPDVNFEQALIDLGIDTDAIINGQVLTSDVSGVTNLNVSSKSIIDLTGIEDFSSLQILICNINPITSLNLSKNTSLTVLESGNNQLTSLDVTLNTVLKTLDCQMNQLTSLDVSKNSALTKLICDINKLTSLDVSKNTNLEYLSIGGFLGGNLITSLNVSQNSALTRLDCDANQLTILDVSQNTALTALRCESNQLTNLNVNGATALTELYCPDNLITSLNVSQNSALTRLDSRDNPSLQCIQVDNVVDANAGIGNYALWEKDATATYSEDCATSGKTYIPDDNFEQALIDLGYDDVLDDYIVTSNISGITSLDVSSKNISDLTGIEDFSNLTELHCYSNQLTSLDVSYNMALITLACRDNQLASLDVIKNTALTILDFYRNQITSIDVSKNTKLIYLGCLDNQLTSLNVSQNTALKELYCSSNQLTGLDISQNTSLTDLWCDKNQLSNLDLSQNTSLFYLKCEQNQLISLNLKNGANSKLIGGIDARNNPSLQCIQVDNETDANTGLAPYNSWSWFKDATATYSENCGYALGIDDEILSEGLNLYPNPVSNTLSIDSKLSLERVEIYSILGQKVKEINKNLYSIYLGDLANGIYLINIHSEKGTTVRKLIKLN